MASLNLAVSAILLLAWLRLLRTLLVRQLNGQ